MGRLQLLGFSSFRIYFWQHHSEEGRDWPLREWPKKVPESPNSFPLPNPEGFVLLLLRTCQSFTSSFLFSHLSLPTSNPGKKNEEKHTNQEGFSPHCVFQLDLNRLRSIQPSHPPSSLLLSCPLCCFFSQTVSSGLGKSSYLPAAWGDKMLQLPIANTTWL